MVEISPCRPGRFDWAGQVSCGVIGGRREDHSTMQPGGHHGSHCRAPQSHDKVLTLLLPNEGWARSGLAEPAQSQGRATVRDFRFHEDHVHSMESDRAAYIPRLLQRYATVTRSKSEVILHKRTRQAEDGPGQ